MESNDWLVNWAISRPSFRSYYFSNKRLISKRTFSNIRKIGTILLSIFVLSFWGSIYSLGYYLAPNNILGILMIGTALNVFVSLFLVPLIGGMIDIFINKLKFERLLLKSSFDKSFEIEYFDINTDTWRYYPDKNIHTHDGLKLFFNDLSVKDLKEMVDEDSKILDKENRRVDAINDIRLRYMALHEANKV